MKSERRKALIPDTTKFDEVMAKADAYMQQLNKIIEQIEALQPDERVIETKAIELSSKWLEEDTFVALDWDQDEDGKVTWMARVLDLTDAEGTVRPVSGVFEMLFEFLQNPQHMEEFPEDREASVLMPLVTDLRVWADKFESLILPGDTP